MTYTGVNELKYDPLAVMSLQNPEMNAMESLHDISLCLWPPSPSWTGTMKTVQVGQIQVHRPFSSFSWSTWTLSLNYVHGGRYYICAKVHNAYLNIARGYACHDWIYRKKKSLLYFGNYVLYRQTLGRLNKIFQVLKSFTKQKNAKISCKDTACHQFGTRDCTLTNDNLLSSCIF